MEQAKTRRRLLRMSIRGLLIVMTILGIALGLWTNSARRQKAAAEKIRAMGGEITYEESSAPEWLVDQLGDDFVSGVKEVRINGFRWSSESPELKFDMKQLALAILDMPSCKSLDIGSVEAKDSDFQHLQCLSDQLVSLRLRETRFGEMSGAGLATFKDWSQLERLSYSCSGNTPPDLSQLATCPKLKEVSLSAFSLEEEHFADLAQCTTLTNIALSQCDFKGKSITQLRALPGLARLSLYNCIPSPYIHTWTIEKDGQQTPVPAKTFHFIGGDPQFTPPPGYQPNFPSKLYDTWKETTLPNVEFFEMYMS